MFSRGPHDLCIAGTHCSYALLFNNVPELCFFWMLKLCFYLGTLKHQCWPTKQVLHQVIQGPRLRQVEHTPADTHQISQACLRLSKPNQAVAAAAVTIA